MRIAEVQKELRELNCDYMILLLGNYHKLKRGELPEVQARIDSIKARMAELKKLFPVERLLGRYGPQGQK